MANRPAILPSIDRNNTNTVDWALSTLQYTGFAPGQVIPSAPHNTLWRLGAEWDGYLDYGTLRATDYLDPKSVQRWSTTRLAYQLGHEIDVDGAMVTNYATYFVGGYRIEIDDSLLRPVGAAPLLMTSATLPGRVWIYLDYGVIALPAQPVAMVRVVSADVGAAPEPNPGELALVGVDVDFQGKVIGNTYPDDDPPVGVTYAFDVQQTFPGTVTLGHAQVTGNPRGLDVVRAPVSWYSHPPVYPWDSEFRVQSRTFPLAGNVPGQPHRITIPLTANEPNQYRFDAMPQNCIVVFWLRMSIFVGNTNEITELVAYRVHHAGSMLARIDGVWNVGEAIGVPSIGIGQAIGVAVFPGTVDNTTAEIRVFFHATQSGKRYRIVADVTAHVLPLD
jgi:hypothetical protein